MNFRWPSVRGVSSIAEVAFLPPEEEVLGRFIGLESVGSDAVLLPGFG